MGISCQPDRLASMAGIQSLGEADVSVGLECTTASML